MISFAQLSKLCDSISIDRLRQRYKVPLTPYEFFLRLNIRAPVLMYIWSVLSHAGEVNPSNPLIRKWLRLNNHRASLQFSEFVSNITEALTLDDLMVYLEKKQYKRELGQLLGMRKLYDVYLCYRDSYDRDDVYERYRQLECLSHHIGDELERITGKNWMAVANHPTYLLTPASLYFIRDT